MCHSISSYDIAMEHTPLWHSVYLLQLNQTSMVKKWSIVFGNVICSMEYFASSVYVLLLTVSYHSFSVPASLLRSTAVLWLAESRDHRFSSGLMSPASHGCYHKTGFVHWPTLSTVALAYQMMTYSVQVTELSGRQCSPASHHARTAKCGQIWTSSTDPGSSTMDNDSLHKNAYELITLQVAASLFHNK